MPLSRPPGLPASHYILCCKCDLGSHPAPWLRFAPNLVIRVLSSDCCDVIATVKMQDSPAALMKRAAVALAFALAYCGTCGAFLPPLAASTLNRGMSLSPSVGGHWERIPHRSAATAVRMAQESSDEELQLAVRQLAAQVEDLRAIVLQLAEPGGVGAGSLDAGAATSQAQTINGATVDSSAAVPVPPAKAAKDASAPLVG